MNKKAEISIAIGDSEVQRFVKGSTVSCCGLKLKYADFPVINRAFAPMVRTLCFDISELALVTFFQALERAKPIRLLPIVVSRKMHHSSLLYDPSRGKMEPEDLPGKSIGIRAYTQTTGMWVRGILSEQYGVNLDEVTWVTYEGAHVSEYRPPANVKIIPEFNESGMIKNGYVDAIITPDGKLKSTELIPLIPNTKDAAQLWFKKHGVVPINHMIAVTEEFINKRPYEIQSIYESFCKAIDLTAHHRESKLSPIGYGATRIWDSGAIQLAMNYCIEQKLIFHTFSKEEIFADIMD